MATKSHPDEDRRSERTTPAKIPFNKPFIAGKELYYIAESVTQAHLSGDGPYSKRCHAWLEEHLGCQKAFLTHSCTGALEMSAILCDLEQGDEVIMPSFTFVSTANAYVLRGAVPVFVDIRPDTLNLDEGLLESAITGRTKAIVPVHYAGVGCAMDEIMAIAAKHELLVIEDAAQGLFSTYRGKQLGAIGHLGCLSFHETKHVISGEGGALLVNDERFVERAEIIREKGTNRNQFFRGEVDKYSWMDIGSSFLPSELVGAFLYAQLEETEEIIRVRRELCQAYYQRLMPLQEEGHIRLPVMESEGASNGHMFYILTGTAKERTLLIAYLRERNISSVFHYVPLHSSPGGLKYGRTVGDMQITDDLSVRLLRLPLYYEMSVSDVNRVTDAIGQFYREAAAG